MSVGFSLREAVSAEKDHYLGFKNIVRFVIGMMISNLFILSVEKCVIPSMELKSSVIKRIVYL